MKLKYIFGTFFCGSLLLCATSCKDDFSDINTNESTLSKPDCRFLFTQTLTDFIPSEYWSWYYDFSNMCKWGQVTAASGSNSNLLNQPDQASEGNVGRVIKYALEIDHQIKQMDEKTAASYQYIKAMTTPLVVYMGIQDTDMYGSMAFSEAYRARYTNPPVLMPKYDTQEELFNDFLAQLDNAINILTNPVKLADGTAVTQVSLGNQDFVYKGDAQKWAKFANSLKLKIAVRLLHVNKAKALEIAKQVSESPAGMLVDMKDDFIYNQGSEWYHGQEDPDTGLGNKTLVDFMVNNKDPRVRFFFTKNDYNSKVIQAFFDAGKELPPFIADKVLSETENGKKVFKGWKAPGEPWVRYHGIPSQLRASSDPAWVSYFDPTGNLYKVSLDNKEKYYNPISAMQLEMYEGNRDFTYPDAPNAPVVQDKEDRAFYGLYFSAGEVNLYLAELKAIGATLPQTAQYYLTEGVKNSVKAWDKVAGLNHIPYYDTAFDKDFEATINLKSDELDYLLTQPAYQLKGDGDDLEKIYIQQRLNFIFMPLDMYVAMRRSGVPMVNSKYLPFENFNTDGSAYLLPRRFPKKDPSPTDKMREIILSAYKQQGFSIGNEASKLNSERVWYDKNAPQFGAGPNF